MSISVYLRKDEAELKLKRKDSLATGPVLSGKMSVEERRDEDARKSARRGERYGSMGEYDPVLRSHCRLDREG